VPRAILDTDILSEILKGVDQQVMINGKEYMATHDFLTFTSVTIYEIITGLERVNAYAKLIRTKELFKLNDEIVPSSEDYILAGQILGTLQRNGRGVGFSDPLIASCAIRRGYSVITGNLRHFQYIRTAGFDLDLLNWRST